MSGTVALLEEEVDSFMKGEDPFTENSSLHKSGKTSLLFNLWEAWPCKIHLLFSCPESNREKLVLQCIYHCVLLIFNGTWEEMTLKIDGIFLLKQTGQEFVCKHGLNVKAYEI